MTKNSSFSERYGYRNLNAEITIREDAPARLRSAIPIIAYGAGMPPRDLYEITCQILLEQSTNIFNDKHCQNETNKFMDGCVWYRIYDIIEEIYQWLYQDYSKINHYPTQCEKLEKFVNKLNQFFCEHGIGWKLENGKILYRGSPAYTESIKRAIETSEQSGRPRAAQEIREAIHDLSRRPPDITGAIQHAIAALEATARNVTNQPNDTLGKLIPKLNLPEPLNTAVDKLWGYASDRARHIREGQNIPVTEAELVVTVACAVCTFLNTRE